VNLITLITVITVITLITIDDSRFSLVPLMLDLCYFFAHTDQLRYLMHNCSFREIAYLCERIIGGVTSVISVITVINVIPRDAQRVLLASNQTRKIG